MTVGMGFPMGMEIDCTGMGGSGNVKSHSRASLIHSPGNSKTYERSERILTNVSGVKLYLFEVIYG